MQDGELLARGGIRAAWLREMVVVVWGAAPLPCPLPCRAILMGCADRLSAACSVGPLLLRHNVAWPRCQGWSSCQPDLTSPLTPRLGTRAAPTARATSAAPCVPRESARQAWRAKLGGQGVPSRSGARVGCSPPLLPSQVRRRLPQHPR